MKVRFYLDKPQKSGNACVLLYASANGTRFKTSTKESVNIELWDAKRERLKRSATNAMEINRRLDILEERAQKIYRDARDVHKVELSAAYLKEHLFAEEKANVPRREISFIEHFETYIQNSETTKKHGTIKTYKNALNHLKEFEKAYALKLSFDMMDVLFYEKFLRYLFKVVGLNSNTAGKVIKILKSFIHYATDTGINTKMKFTKFKVLTEEVVTVSLTDEELEKIEALDFSKDERLIRARNLFLIECYSGLRYSDIQRLKAENVKGATVSFQTIKTKDNLSIPLNEQAEKQIKFYLDSGLPPISIQRLNEYIKEIVTRAEINEPIHIVNHKGTERIEKTVPKHTLISTHTGRRTFITLSLEKGMRPEIVMDIVGIKDPKTFRKYIRLTEKIKEAEMSKWSKKPKEEALIS